jgi:heme o synthase
LYVALCRRVALRYTAVLTGLSLAAPFVDVTNTWFALESLPLNLYFGYLGKRCPQNYRLMFTNFYYTAWRFYQKSDSGSSRKLFRFSLLHLPLLMVLFLLNKNHWIFIEEKDKLDAVVVEAIEATTVAATSPPSILPLNLPSLPVKKQLDL